MKVSGLNSDNDWRFGKGRAAYKAQGAAIRQNVATRLRSFTGDWFLDMSAGVPWLTLFDQRGSERRILRAIERTVLQTEGVRAIDRLRVTGRDASRAIVIKLRYIDVFDQSTEELLELP